MSSGRRQVMSTSVRLNLRFQTSSRRRRHSHNETQVDTLYPAVPTKKRKLESGRGEGSSLLLSPCGGVSDCDDNQLVPGNEADFLPEDLDLYESELIKKTPVDETSNLNPRGFFFILPNELLHHIFSLLSHAELGSLSLTSNEMNICVRDYLFTVMGSRHILPIVPPMVTGSGHILSAQPFIDENTYHVPDKSVQSVVADIVRQFESLGMLMKRLTMMQSLRCRLKTASFFLNKLDYTHQALIYFAGHSTAYYCFGCLFHTFIQGWEDYEKMKAYNLVESIAKLQQRVEKVLRSSPSTLYHLERDIRLVHRRVFLDHAIKRSEEEYEFWLTLILKPWPITFQARLLYLFTAPEDSNGFISWTEACGCSHLQHEMGSDSVDFSELANSLRVMLECGARNWTMDDIISIIDELTTTPNGWCLENVAQLLILCGNDISKGVLGCKAANGHVEELVVICFYLGNACAMKDNITEGGNEQNIRWFLDVVKSTINLLPNSINKPQFLSNLMSKWQDYLTALFEDCAPDDAEADEIQVEFLSTLGNFTKLSSFLLQSVLNQS